MSEATRLLLAMGRQDPLAAGELLPLVYEELRRLARAQLAHERAGHTLQATALVHEAYLRLTDGGAPKWESRRHFFGAAAEAMRRILVEHARRKRAMKRGGARRRLELADDELPEICSPCDHVDDLLALNAALDRLSREHPAKAELITLLYFAGLSLQEAAGLLGLSKTAAHRQSAFARAWLYEAMNGKS